MHVNGECSPSFFITWFVAWMCLLWLCRDRLVFNIYADLVDYVNRVHHDYDDDDGAGSEPMWMQCPLLRFVATKANSSLFGVGIFS